VLESLASLDAPLKGVLNGSAAFLRGEHVLVDASNAMFADLIRKSEHQKPLLEAVRRITGKPYKVGIFMRSFKLKEPENDVMDEIASKAKSQGINVIER
jgi:DNA polymerase-3 subunit gamma/tau